MAASEALTRDTGGGRQDWLSWLAGQGGQGWRKHQLLLCRRACLLSATCCSPPLLLAYRACPLLPASAAADSPADCTYEDVPVMKPSLLATATLHAP